MNSEQLEWHCMLSDIKVWALGELIDGNKLANIGAIVNRLANGNWSWTLNVPYLSMSGIEPSRETAMNSAEQAYREWRQREYGNEVIKEVMPRV